MPTAPRSTVVGNRLQALAISRAQVDVQGRPALDALSARSRRSLNRAILALSVLAKRKPMLLFRLVGLFRLRMAERQF